MEPVLFPGEKRLHDAAANLLIKLTLATAEGPRKTRDEALVATAQALASLFEGSAVGGHLTLTTHRFFFVSHRANLTRGTCSLFLSTITSEHSVDGFISDTLTLETGAARHELVVRNAKAFRDALARARSAAPTVAELAAQVRARPGACGQSALALIGEHPSYETLNATLAALSPGGGVSALDLACAVNVAELLRQASRAGALTE